MATDYTERDAKEIKQVVEGTHEQFKRPASAIKAGVQDSGSTISNNHFPANYFQSKDDEKRVKLVQEYSAFLKDKKGLSTLYVPTEDDINVLLRKDQEKELLNFETFIQEYFDLQNPIHQKLVRELYPNYFERRLDVIRETLSLQERIAKIKLLGMQTKEDVFFVYGLMNGDIKIDDLSKAVFNLDTTVSNADRFNRGFLNTKRWAAAGSVPANPLGDKRGKGLFESGVVPPKNQANTLNVAGLFPGIPSTPADGFKTQSQNIANSIFNQ
jgi:hypothetical protein